MTKSWESRKNKFLGHYMPCSLDQTEMRGNEGNNKVGPDRYGIWGADADTYIKK